MRNLYCLYIQYNKPIVLYYLLFFAFIARTQAKLTTRLCCTDLSCIYVCYTAPVQQVGECPAGIIRVQTKGIQVTGKSISRIGDPPKKATKTEENLLLSELQQWEIIEHGAQGNGRRELHKIYEFETFEAAFQFMSAAATRIISAQDHHPRWENMYKRVEVWLSTFDLEDQISDRDLKLARSLDQLWEELGE